MIDSMLMNYLVNRALSALKNITLNQRQKEREKSSKHKNCLHTQLPSLYVTLRGVKCTDSLYLLQCANA